MTSRNVRWASVAFWKASKTFLSATVCLFCLSVAFQTTPYAPLPSFSRMSYFRRMCGSNYSAILPLKYKL